MTKEKEDMARVAFSRAFDWRPPGVPQSVISYKAGKTYTVKRACAEEAVAKGAGKIVAARRRPSRAPMAEAVENAAPEAAGSEGGQEA